MRTLSLFRRVRLLPVAALLLLGLLVSPVHIGAVHAGLGTCANCYGPIIMLSDGTKINTGVNVSDDRQDTQGVTYVLYLPQGITVKNISFQGSNQVPQSLTVAPSSTAPNTYQVDTVVSTGTSPISVASSTQVNSAETGCYVSSSVPGQSNTTITTSVDASSC